ncbi:hypothetical protein HUO07_16645 [Halomonas sp. QX-1]|uniref:Uncharacterized protein n=1 Tax=Vreelandella maris TaxID=2729617 RepID=A0A7Y6RFE5_9GAMM|nr:phage protease [Halomonas maris]NVF15788.1 hypothetical protein [Halomonas maris]|tara:strand:- start:365 stop:784 length:420 start_codon:yes stop_codon:yes gene_type:complete
MAGRWSYGSIDWTAKARAAITPGPDGGPAEYLYLYPVFPYDANGVPLDLLHLALTNAPANDECAAQLAAARMAITHDVNDDDQEINTVKREQLIATLGLAVEATSEQIDTVKKWTSRASSRLTGIGANLIGTPRRPKTV